MSKDEAAIEAEIQEKNLNAPRLSPKSLQCIHVEQLYIFPGTTMTLRNGSQVIGKSATTSPENSDTEIG